jgi:hypothetical protein
MSCNTIEAFSGLQMGQELLREKDLWKFMAKYLEPECSVRLSS